MASLRSPCWHRIALNCSTSFLFFPHCWPHWFPSPSISFLPFGSTSISFFPLIIIIAFHPLLLSAFFFLFFIRDIVSNSNCPHVPIPHSPTDTYAKKKQERDNKQQDQFAWSHNCSPQTSCDHGRAKKTPKKTKEQRKKSTETQ